MAAKILLDRGTKMADDALTRKDAEMGVLPCPFCGRAGTKRADVNTAQLQFGCPPCRVWMVPAIWNKRALSESGWLIERYIEEGGLTGEFDSDAEVLWKLHRVKGRSFKSFKDSL